MFEALVADSSEQVDEVDLAEFRAQLWDEPSDDDPDDMVWAERERIAHALWEQEYLTTDGALARVARYSADESRCVGSKVRATNDFVAARERQVAIEVAEEARDGGTRAEVEATINAARESAEAELGLWMHLSPGAASEWIDFATGLARRLPMTLNHLEAGRISERFARILLKETRNLTAPRQRGSSGRH